MVIVKDSKQSEWIYIVKSVRLSNSLSFFHTLARGNINPVKEAHASC